MTTPNEELIERLRDPQTRGTTGEWFDRAEGANALQAQAERIAELERESETHAKAYGLAIVERDNLRHELKVAQEGWRCECSTDDACRFARERDELRAELGDLLEAQAEMLAEIKQLRAQLAEIAATEPVAKLKPCKEGWFIDLDNPPPITGETIELFTRPMPAQDVTELVEALETLARLGNGEHYGNSDGNMIARDALYKYKGAK